MANSSIYAVFERMWQHALAKFNSCVPVEAFEHHVADTENPHYVTKEQIGLDSVDNTSDIDKPISNATQVALDEKADTDHVHDEIYYTKDELSEMFELITIDDIDNICLPSISFTIGSTLYQAKEGMTWSEWINSKYNTGGWFISSGMYIDIRNGTIPGVVATATIIPNNVYQIYYY